MRISISNLAWDINEDVEVVSLLKEYAIDAIDIAPGKYFPEPDKATLVDIRAVKTWWHNQGIDIIGMQSLLFGTVGLNVFSSEMVQQMLLRHLTHICRIGSELGATRLVFGSPKNRDCTGLSATEIKSKSQVFFRKLGDIAADNGVIISLEPNPIIYGANFMTSSNETYNVVKEIAHSNIKMQLDTGAMIINHENITEVVEQVRDVIGHIHLSEAHLSPVGDSYAGHAAFADVLKNYFGGYPATIEMLATPNEPHLASIRRALSHVTSLYN
ncbi:sugar phosphate isomerase/epimerase family protein [Buttiauxella noackiae]|uniref:sugar phosphate isomerase/epimerase family protein n=2 Tax=Buttiauxella noackiae TaxID=82992 RepID=UPI00054E4E98|nr:TIM barrel protein [Buttiauxella noackiae]